jgi:tetratricopeptide (TPR) repeat protein
MSFNTAIIPGSLVNSEPAIVAEALRSLVQDNMTDQARQVFYRYRQAREDDRELALLYADILLKAGELAEAESLLERELQKNPDHFALLFRIGRLDEMRGAYINAHDLFRRAELLAVGVDEKREVQQALERVKDKIRSEVIFKPDTFLIKLEGNLNPLNLQYQMPQLIRRRELLEALLTEIDPRAKSILEIECDAGVVTRNLAVHGFKVEGTAAEMADLVLSMGFEYVEMLRKAGNLSPDYRCIDFDTVAAGRLDKYDIILVLPTRLNWYRERGAAGAAAVFKQLVARSKRQLFFYLPANSDHREETAAIAESLLAEFALCPGLFAEPVLCFENSAGDQLYRINQRQAGEGDRSKILPFGLAAVGSRSTVLEVEVDRCRSLNGFAFTGSGWNHFTALLEEILSKPNLAYEDSILKLFFDRFQPESRQAQLYGATAEKLPPLDRGFTLLPWVDTKNRRFNPVESPVLHTGGNPHYGPNSIEFGNHVCKRLLANYTLLKQYGYLPEIFPDGYIQGYLLKDGSDYRFYVNEGQHRMAAVGLLGLKTIKARFNPDFLPVVDLKNIKQWPQVRRGLYSEAVAAKVFHYYFEEDGRRKAQMLGLLEATNALPGQ